MKSKSKKDAYIGTAKVGPKGQIVIPKEVRDFLGIETGDTLILVANKKQGIGINKISYFKKFTEAMLNGMSPSKSEDIEPSPDDSKGFAEVVNDIITDEARDTSGDETHVKESQTNDERH